MEDLLRIEYVPLDEVRRWGRNPKKHDMGALVAAIERYGFVDPPKFDRALGALVYGNGRDEALEWMKSQGRAAPRGIRVDESGRWLVPVKFGVDAASQGEAEALAIDHNNLTMAGGDFTAFDMARMWDASYAGLLEGLQVDDALPLTLDASSLSALLADVGHPQTGEGDDAPPVVDESRPTRCQPGDVWCVGTHIIACLDSTESGNLDRVLAGRKLAMVWADPPYGVNFDAAAERGGPFGGVKTGGKIIPSIPRPDVIGDETTETARAAVRICLAQFEDALHFWWGANNYADELPPSQCWIVWDKENTGDFADVELCWTNIDGAARLFRHMWNGMLKDSERGERRVHATQKPIALCEWAFKKYGKPGDFILDPFLGSGPSLKAAHRMGDGRRVVGFELSPHYCDHILEWASAAGLTCVKESHA